MSFDYQNISMLQITEFNSNKSLQNVVVDPLINIVRQLRDLGAEQGNYIRIIEKETFFQPIYKISYIQERRSKQEEAVSIRKSVIKDSSNQVGFNEHKPIGQNQQKIRLSFGSKIFLKYNSLLHARVALIKPYFLNLFVNLNIRGKGLIHCIDGKIVVGSIRKKESIWMCIRNIVEQTRPQFQEQSKNQVIFCNLTENLYLNIDSSGIMTVCSEQRATRFTLRRIESSDSYLLFGRNPLSVLIRNKSKQQIKKIIDRSIERNEGARSSLQIELQIKPVEDATIQIHFDLNYSRKALQKQPSLKLIKLVLNELIYYEILDFLKDNSILSEHFLYLLLQNQILALIQNHLYQYFDKQKEEQVPIMILPHRVLQQQRLSRFNKNSSKPQYDEHLINEILKTIGLICRQNAEISKIFENLLDLFIIQEHYHFAALLLSKNQYFFSLFHKANWYSHLYRTICRSSKSQVCKIIQFLCLFCEGHKELTLDDSSIPYRNLPSTNNQYLLYHSVKAGDFFQKIFQYELYIEGIYVFIHDTKSGKDIQFHTFVQGPQSDYQRQSKQQGKSSLKIQLQDSHQNQISGVDLVATQLKLLKSMYHYFNPNIVINNWTIVYGLVPYCYKENFPQITNHEIKSTILKLLIELQPCYKQAKIISTFLVSCLLVEGDNNLGRNAVNEEDSKITASSFIKNNQKKVKTSRKVLKEMGNYFLKKTKGWAQSLRKRTLHIYQLCNSEEEYLSQWLQIMIQVISSKLFKVKQKKEGQLLGYIKKLFQSIEDKKGETQSQGNLMNQFVEILLQIAKIHPKYDKYLQLQPIKAKRVYQGKSMQINKVISNLQGKRQVSFSRTQKGLTKIQLIDRVHEEVNIRQSTKKQVELKDHQQFQNIKLSSLRLIQLIILNVNEQMIHEAVETLTYLIKNSNAISNLSSFTLLDMIPKYPYESSMKKIALQQWYLSSNCQLLNECTQILRLLYTKRDIFRRNVNNVLLIDQETTFKIFHHIIYPVKILRKVAHHCEAWLRPSLLEKYPDIYVGVDKNLQVIIDCMQKISDNGDYKQASKIIQNVDLIAILLQFLEYISSYYIQQQSQSALQKSRMFHLKAQLTFIQSKLNPLVEKIIKILLAYTDNRHGNDLFRTKIIINTFGNVISSINEFSYVLVDIVKQNIQSSQQNLLELLGTIAPITLCNLLKNLSKTWKFFEFYLYLENEDLLRQANSLYVHGFSKFSQFQEEKFIRDFLNNCFDKGPHENNQKQQIVAGRYEFAHQIVLIKIILKLIYNNYIIDIVIWFKEKILWHLIETISKNNAQNYYMSEMTIEEIKRRQMIAQLAFYYKDIEIPQKDARIYEDDQAEDSSTQIIDFILKEHQISKLYIDLDNENNKKMRKMTENAYLQYLEYLVCDLAVLAYSVQFLTVGQLYEDLSKYFDKLKEIYKRRVTSKQNQQTFASFSNIERLFWKESNIKYECKLRKVKFERLGINSENNSQQVKPKSKSIRKWMKAVAQINKQRFLNKSSEFIDDLLTFEEIYQLKQSQQINLVINQNDIFLKLIQVSLNLKRLKITLQNQIFLLQSLAITAKGRHKKKKQLDDGLVEYGMRLLQLLRQQQGSYESEENSKNLDSKWKNNTYCLALILKIIEYSKCIQVETYWDLLFSLFEQSIVNYQTDCTFLHLYFSTLHTRQEIQMFQVIIPFEILLIMFTKQIGVMKMSQQIQKSFAKCLLKGYLSFNLNLQCQLRRYTQSQLLKLIDGMDKNIIAACSNELRKKQYFKHLLAIKR